MNEEAERIFQAQPGSCGPRGPSPRLHGIPRVQGGPCLDGAPKLESLGIALPSRTAPSSAKVADAPLAAVSPVSRPKDIRSPLERSVRPVLESPGQKPGGAQLGVECLHKVYRKGPLEIPVLRGVDLTVQAGEFLAIVGQSGSGKSTLLHLLGTLDSPTAGQIFFEGRRIDNLPPRARDEFRNSTLGIIFQFYHLLPELDTLENVLMPAMIASGWWGYWRARRAYRESAVRILQQVGLGERLHHKPAELSGGEMQRAAIARALVAQPKLLLADEPTGNLDRQTGQEILQLLCSLNHEHRLTIVMVTHDPAIAAQADRVVHLVDGCIAPG